MTRQEKFDMFLVSALCGVCADPNVTNANDAVGFAEDIAKLALEASDRFADGSMRAARAAAEMADDESTLAARKEIR